MNNIESKITGKTTTIRALVRIVPKIHDTFYSFEYSEERTVPEDCNLEEERTALFDTCYNTVAEQIELTVQNA